MRRRRRRRRRRRGAPTQIFSCILERVGSSY
jgi:hypothetical protein